MINYNSFLKEDLKVWWPIIKTIFETILLNEIRSEREMNSKKD